jgi:serine/threonine-protein kinase
MKTCPSCSLQNIDEAGFCGGCGSSLRNLPPPEAAIPGVLPAAAWPPFATTTRRDEKGYLLAGIVIDGKYTIEQVIGQGGMGVIYLARDVHTKTSVVVKAIRDEIAHSPEFRGRAIAEGRALARIDHPNVVRLNAVVLDEGQLYLVMQFIEGFPLDRILDEHHAAGRTIPLDEALRLFRMILHGVAAAHHEGERNLEQRVTLLIANAEAGQRAFAVEGRCGQGDRFRNRQGGR